MYVLKGYIYATSKIIKVKTRLNAKYIVLTYFIAFVWCINGIVKLFDLVPRHRLIVERILGSEYSGLLTKAIGFLELFMCLWVLSGIKMKLNTALQIAVVAMMNTMEYFIVPDILLWGKLNAFFALLFIILIYIRFVCASKLSRVNAVG